MAVGVQRGIPETFASITSEMICNQAVVERALEDGSVSSIKIAASIQSENWDGTTAGADDATQGWRIEFNTDTINIQDAVVRGTVYADAGEISGDLIVGGIDAGSITTGTLQITGTMAIENAGGGTVIDSAGIRADQIYTGSLTALTYRTAASGRRLEITPTIEDQMMFYNSSNIVVGTFGIDETGNFFLESSNASVLVDAPTSVEVTTDSFSVLGGSPEAYQFSVVSDEDDPVYVVVSNSLKQVTRGAADSGGSGYRVLRVEN